MTDTAATPEMGTEGLNLNQATTAIEAFLTSQEDGPAPEENTAQHTEEGDAPEGVDEGQDDGETDDKPAEGDEPVYEVTLPGGEKVNVPVSELLKGYSREADYTKKTMQVAEGRKEIEAQAARVQAEAQSIMQAKQAYQEKLTQLDQLLAAEPDIDWESLIQTNPTEYLIQKRLQEKRQEARQQVQAEKEKTQAELQAQHKAQFDAYVAQEFGKLVTKAPDFGDPDKGAKLMKEVTTYLQKEGYSSQELETLADHRAVNITRKAMLYDAMQQAAKTTAEKKVAHVPKVQKPGTVRETTSQQEQAKALKARAMKTGSTQDAARYIEQQFL